MNWFTKKAAEGDNPFSLTDLLNRMRSSLGFKSPELDTSYLSRPAPTLSKAKPTVEDVLRHIVKENPNIDLGEVADELYDRGVTPDRIDEATLEELLYPTRPAQAEYKSLYSPENIYRLGKDGGLNRLAAIANGAPAIAQPEIDFSPVHETALSQAAEEPANNVTPFSEKDLSPYMRAMASPYDPVGFPSIKSPKSIGNPTIRSAVDLSRDNIDVSHAADDILGAPVEAEDVEGLLGQFASPRYKMKFNMPNMAPESLGEASMGYYAPLEGTEWDRVQAALDAKRGLKPLPEDEVSIARPNNIPAGAPPIEQPEIDFASATDPIASPFAGTSASTGMKRPGIPAGAPPIAQPEIDFADAAEPVVSPLAINPEDNNLPEGAADPGVIPNMWNQRNEERRYVMRPGGESSIVRPNIIPDGVPAVEQPEIDFTGATEPVVSPLTETSATTGVGRPGVPVASPLAINPEELEGQIPSPQSDIKFNMPNMAPESLGEASMGYYAPLEGTEWDRVQAALDAKRGLKPLPEDEVSAPEAASRATPNIWNQRNEERRYVMRPGGESSIVRPNIIPAGAPPIAQPEIDFADAAEPVVSPLAINPEEFYMPNSESEEAPGLTLGDIDDSPRALSPFTPVEAPSLANSLNTRVSNQGPIYNFLDQLRAVENTPGSSLSDFPISQ